MPGVVRRGPGLAQVPAESAERQRARRPRHASSAAPQPGARDARSLRHHCRPVLHWARARPSAIWALAQGSSCARWPKRRRASACSRRRAERRHRPPSPDPAGDHRSAPADQSSASTPPVQPARTIRTKDAVSFAWRNIPPKIRKEPQGTGRDGCAKCRHCGRPGRFIRTNTHEPFRRSPRITNLRSPRRYPSRNDSTPPPSSASYCTAIPEHHRSASVLAVRNRSLEGVV